MANPRDYQRSRVYAAEKAAFGRAEDWKDRVATVSAMERYVKDLSADREWTDLVWPEQWTVKDGRGRRRGGASAGPGWGLITVPRFARAKWYVLHEVSHVVTTLTYGVGVAAHGPEFCGVYLRLVQKEMGRQAADALFEAFVEQGADVAPSWELLWRWETAREEVPLAAGMGRRHEVGTRIAKDEVTRLKLRISERGLTQKAVAEALGVAPTTVMTWCLGYRKPGDDRLKELAKFLKVKVSDRESLLEVIKKEEVEA